MFERHLGQYGSSSIFYGLALLLVIGVLVLNVGDSIYGLYGIFSLFVGGVATVLVTVGLGLVGVTSGSTVKALLAGGSTLVVGAIFLYLIFGCVFGCPA